MKKYSNYIIKMVCAGLVCFVLAIISFNYELPNACAGMTAFSFIFLWVASMAPDHEKYRG
jgi:hypothetical protein